jgi:phosphoribosylformylglycinamidine synthase subunit PurS
VRRRFEVGVYPKRELADPQGKAIEDSAPAMGWVGISDVRVGKYITFTVDAESAEGARSIAGEMAERLLSNPVIEAFWLLEAEPEE